MNPDLSPKQMIGEFLLEQIVLQPVEQRILLYRALAVEADDKQLRADCAERANELEATARRERQMLLNFRRRNA